jgi:hypothetical protein
MRYPFITNDAYSDADAMDRYHQEHRGECLECDKCGYEIEEGEEYFFISIKGFDDIHICENCITDFKTIHLEEE